jgi:hypothetical protein
LKTAGISRLCSEPFYARADSRKGSADEKAEFIETPRFLLLTRITPLPKERRNQTIRPYMFFSLLSVRSNY